MLDIEESIPLIPGGYIDLSHSHSSALLYRFHAVNEHNLVRGMDSVSNFTFLSILLHSVITGTQSFLLICRFNASGLEGVAAMHVDSASSEFEAWSWELPDPITIGDLQQLLVDRYKMIDIMGYPEMWTMEGKIKRCCRWTVHGAVSCCRDLRDETCPFMAPIFWIFLVFVVFYFTIIRPNDYGT